MKIAQVEETAGRINLHKLILRDYNFRASRSQKLNLFRLW